MSANMQITTALLLFSLCSSCHFYPLMAAVFHYVSLYDKRNVVTGQVGREKKGREGERKGEREGKGGRKDPGADEHDQTTTRT